MEDTIKVNRGFLDMTGHESDDLLGHTVYEFDVFEGAQQRDVAIERLSQGETSLNVPVIDVSENNDWSQVRVWHIPGEHWGGRVYSTQGFIHPYRLDGGAGLISD